MAYTISLFQKYISSSLHVAIALWSFCQVIAVQQEVFLSFSMQLAVFGFGWAGYHYVQVFVPLLYKQQKIPISNAALLSFALVIGGCGLYWQPSEIRLVFAFLGLITFSYALPFGPQMGLRFVPTIKIGVVALCWAIMACISLVYLPLDRLMLVALKALLWVLVLMFPFELRDSKKDPSHLKTLPQLIGIGGVKILGYMLILITAYLAYQTVPIHLLLWVEWTMLFVLAIAIKSSPNPQRNFASFWVEGIPIIWLVFTVAVLTLC